MFTPEMFSDRGIARGINPRLAPGEIIDSPNTNQYISPEILSGKYPQFIKINYQQP